MATDKGLDTNIASGVERLPPLKEFRCLVCDLVDDGSGYLTDAEMAKVLRQVAENLESVQPDVTLERIERFREIEQQAIAAAREKYGNARPLHPTEQLAAERIKDLADLARDVRAKATAEGEAKRDRERAYFAGTEWKL